MRYPDIRRSKYLAATGEFHSQTRVKKAASPYKAVIVLSHTTALLGEPYSFVLHKEKQKHDNQHQQHHTTQTHTLSILLFCCKC